MNALFVLRAFFIIARLLRSLAPENIEDIKKLVAEEETVLRIRAREYCQRWLYKREFSYVFWKQLAREVIWQLGSGGMKINSNFP